MKGQKESNTHKEQTKTMFYNFFGIRAVSKRVSWFLLWPSKYGRKKGITHDNRVFAPDLESVAVSTTREKSRHEFEDARGFEEICTNPVPHRTNHMSDLTPKNPPWEYGQALK